MASNVQVRRARLQDAQMIADFVNKARPGTTPVTRMDVAERFSYVGFFIAEFDGQMVGLLGWQIENLVVRVTDFLIAPSIDRVVAGKAMIMAMEEEGRSLEAEAAVLFLPAKPSAELVSFWELFGYEKRLVSELPKAWREAVLEWNSTQNEVMLKKLREGMVRRPI